MRNCLVTKLKGTVDNPSLLKLGECRVRVKNLGSAIAKLYINCYNSQGGDETVTFNHAIPYYQENVLQPAATVIHLSNGSQMQWVLEPGEEVYASFSYKYGIYYLNDDNKHFEMTLEGFDFFPQGLKYYDCRMIKLTTPIDITPFCGSRTEVLACGYPHLKDSIYGNIDGLAGNTSLIMLAISYLTNISGNIENLVSALSVQSLEFKNVPLHGSLNALFDAWAAAGKTGSILLTFSGSNCTLTGVTTYSDNKVTFSNGSWTISDWNA